MDRRINFLKGIADDNKKIMFIEVVILSITTVFIFIWGLLNKPVTFSLFYEIYFSLSFIGILLLRKRVNYYYWLAMFFLVLVILSTGVGKVNIANDFSAIVFLYIVLGFTNHLISPEGKGE